MKILYFTATGNSLYIAKSIGGKLYSIPQMVKEGTYEFTDEKIGIVFPLHAWAVPPYIVDFLKKAKFNCDYLFAITTYGIYSGAVGKHLSDIGDEAGFRFSYINRIRMVDNYLRSIAKVAQPVIVDKFGRCGRLPFSSEKKLKD